MIQPAWEGDTEVEVELVEEEVNQSTVAVRSEPSVTKTNSQEL
jgi:hypothetical protein